MKQYFFCCASISTISIDYVQSMLILLFGVCFNFFIFLFLFKKIISTCSLYYFYCLKLILYLCGVCDVTSCDLLLYCVVVAKKVVVLFFFFINTVFCA